ncbi:MAG: hypothetical protein KAR42_07150 [candidate division Zixibacteria bacterium]|nr:hypothetical protein [candidate division Zixibacteria bacterium]
MRQIRQNCNIANQIQYDREIPISAFSAPVSKGNEKIVEKIVSSARENVKFLNFHLSRYAQFIETPPYADNALYLAYTIKVIPNSSFTASEFRRFLHRSGLETMAEFTFAHQPEMSLTKTQFDAHNDLNNNDIDTFCIACNHNLTILDVQSILRRIDTFFEMYVGI